MEVNKIAEFNAPYWKANITRPRINGIRIEITGLNRIFREIQLSEFGLIEFSVKDSALFKRGAGYLFMLANISGLAPYFYSNWGMLRKSRKFRLFYNIQIAFAENPFYVQRPAFLEMIPDSAGLKKQVISQYKAKVYTY